MSGEVVMEDAAAADKKVVTGDAENEDGEEETVEEKVEQLPNFALARLIFLLKSSDDVVSAARKAQAKADLMALVRELKAVSLYERVCVGELGWAADADFLKEGHAHLESTLKDFTTKIQEAEDTLGATDVRDLMHERANFHCRVGDLEGALKAYREVLHKTSEPGRKIDVHMSIIRIGLFNNDGAVVNQGLDDVRDLVEKAGDWDRRNRLKVYEGIWTVAHTRDFTKGSTLLLQTLSTFAAVEFLDFKDFVWYAAVIACPALDRVKLKEKVMDSPEFVQAIPHHPQLDLLLSSLHGCRYADFFKGLAAVTDAMKEDMFLAPHAGYFCKEMRVKAYSQLLQSYRSLQVSQVAAQFGVTEEFVDKELSRFIAAGRLQAKIDKVNGAVETSRAGGKVFQYQTVQRQGDALLNRVQQLSRVINL